MMHSACSRNVQPIKPPKRLGRGGKPAAGRGDPTPTSRDAAALAPAALTAAAAHKRPKITVEMHALQAPGCGAGRRARRPSRGAAAAPWPAAFHFLIRGMVVARSLNKEGCGASGPGPSRPPSPSGLG
jgi:hypothetical protein